MTELTQAEMGPILFAHGMAEMRFDVEEAMMTVVPEPHYEISVLNLAIDGREAVREMYRRLLAANRNRNLQIKVRVDSAGKNTLMQEAYASFDNGKGERVTGIYMTVVEFDPERKQIVGERMYGESVWTQLWAESLGDDFMNVPGVSRITDNVPVFG